MDLSGARYRSLKRGPVTYHEKKRLRDNYLCLYCSSSGHWASQCPHKRSRGKPSVAAAASSEGGVLIPTPAMPVVSAASVAPAQLLYQAKNKVPLQIALSWSAPGCHLGVLNLIFCIILFVPIVCLLVVILLVFLLFVFPLLLIVGLSVPSQNPLYLLLLSGRIFFQLLKKSRFMIFL